VTPPMVNAALTYARRGWPVFACGRNKRRLTTHGFKDASVDAGTIKSLFSSWPDAGIGIPTGIDGKDAHAHYRIRGPRDDRRIPDCAPCAWRAHRER
jgi:hypothetical protein